VKILFLTTEYSSCKLPDCGGLGTFIKVLSEELVTTGNQVLLLGFAKKDITFFDNEIKVIFKKNYFKKYPVLEIIRSIASSLKFTSLEKLLSKKERIYYAKVLKNIANNEKVDIIEAHAFNGLSAMWDNSIPLVVRFHGSRGFWHKYLGKKNEPIKMYFEKEALLNTPNIIAVSKFSSQAINAIYDLNLEPKIIYNGIDINLFSSKYNVDEIPKSIFYVGTLSDAKGLNVLCAIFNKIIEIHPDATLHLIGRGKE
jgi:glycosyltransferase involved in cell wall biosynthesis